MYLLLSLHFIQILFGFCELRCITSRDYVGFGLWRSKSFQRFDYVVRNFKIIELFDRYRIMTEIIHATTISSLKKDQSKAGKARSLDKVLA